MIFDGLGTQRQKNLTFELKSKLRFFKLRHHMRRALINIVQYLQQKFPIIIYNP